MFRSLQSRITAGFVAVIAVVVAILGVTLVLLSNQTLQSQYAAGYAADSSAAYYVMAGTLQGQPFSSLLINSNVQKIAQYLSNNFHVRVQVVVNGIVVADTGPSKSDPSRHLAVDAFGSNSFPIRVAGVGQIGSLIISQPLTDRAYREQQFAQNVVWAGIAACLLAIFIGGILSERLTARLRAVTRATARMGAGHLDERVPEGRRDEAGELARQFNRMAGRLEESFATISSERDRLRQFVAEVSHELRTPLTALRTFNDLLSDGAGDDPATRHDFLTESARQIERLDWLTHNLLDLSRLDAGITQVTPREADLAETLRQAAETNRPAAAAKDIALNLDLRPVPVPHDPRRLEQALSNVVGNAIKFSPRGATVRARVYTDGDTAVVEVSDEGPGIPPDEAPHIFDRFYRGHDANRAGEGSGLGLAISRAILDAHRGTISVQSAPGHGATMRLTLPLAQAPRESTREAPMEGSAHVLNPSR